MSNAIEARLELLERSFATAARDDECKISWLKTRIANLVALSKRGVAESVELGELLDNGAIAAAVNEVRERIVAVSARYLNDDEQFRLFGELAAASQIAIADTESVTTLHRVRSLVDELAGNSDDDDEREIQLYALSEQISKGIDAIRRMREGLVPKAEVAEWRRAAFAKYLHGVERYVDEGELLAIECELFAA